MLIKTPDELFVQSNNMVLNNEEIEVLTPQDECMYADITSFRIKGKTSLEVNREFAKTLLDKY